MTPIDHILVELRCESTGRVVSHAKLNPSVTITGRRQAVTRLLRDAGVGFYCASELEVYADGSDVVLDTYAVID